MFELNARTDNILPVGPTTRPIPGDSRRLGLTLCSHSVGSSSIRSAASLLFTACTTVRQLACTGIQALTTDIFSIVGRILGWTPSLASAADFGRACLVENDTVGQCKLHMAVTGSSQMVPEIPRLNRFDSS